MNLSETRTRVRRDLHDEDAGNYRWTDSELDRHIERAVRELSLAAPLEAKATLTTAAESRDLSLATLTDLVTVEAVEYPAGKYPPSYVPFSLWAGTLTLLVDRRLFPAALPSIRRSPLSSTQMRSIRWSMSSRPTSVSLPRPADTSRRYWANSR